MLDAEASKERRRGSEEAERAMKWHGEHVPYSVYDKLPELKDDEVLGENYERVDL